MPLTRFWHRRICEAVILITVVIIALYVWPFIGGKNFVQALPVAMSVAATAAVAMIIGIVFYFWMPTKQIVWSTLAVYAALCITTAMLVLTTGATVSPFLAVWMAVLVFAGVFGIYGLLPLFLALAGYLIWQFSTGTLTREMIVTIVLTGELPLVVSYLIWHQKGVATPPAGDRAYRELATELSQVAGKAEVVINAIGDGVIALNGQGVIQLINPAAQQIIGWGKQDALALSYKSVLKLVDQNDQELTTANDPVAQVLGTNKETSSKNLKLMTNSGKKILIALVVSPVGQLGAGVIIVFRDITKEKAEEREQAEFVSTASHEMRTPVASIEGYLGLALNPATAQIDDKAREFITKAHDAAQHLGRLFQDLLDVTKAEDGRLPNNPKVVDVVAFTQDIVDSLRPKAQAKQLRVLFKPNPDNNPDAAGGERRLNPVYYANVDNDHLREVLSNLIDNAIKYTPQGEVVVDITGDSDHVVMSVTDSGIGIPKEDQVHLFQKFYRVDNSDTREIGGTGLGLYLSRRLVESMSGRIWVESEYKRGSTFFVEIPRISHEEATRLIESASLQVEQPIVVDQTFLPTQAPPVATPPTPQPTMPPQAASPALSRAAYIAPRPAPGPVVAPSPPQLVTQTPAPQPQTPPQYQPQPAVSSRPNTPLSSIEQNPASYLGNRPGAAPAPRNRNQP